MEPVLKRAIPYKRMVRKPALFKFACDSGDLAGLNILLLKHTGGAEASGLWTRLEADTGNHTGRYNKMCLELGQGNYCRPWEVNEARKGIYIET